MLGFHELRPSLHPSGAEGRCLQLAEDWRPLPEGVKCIKGICGGRLPLNAPCVLGGKGQCQAGLKCWGFSRTDTRCTKLAPRGAKCDWQLTGVHCEKGVKCVGGVCGRPARVVKVTEKCDGKRTICGPNAACLAGHCFIVSPVGGKCGTNPFYVCEGGNVCVHGKCKSGAQCKC